MKTRLTMFTAFCVLSCLCVSVTIGQEDDSRSKLTERLKRAEATIEKLQAEKMMLQDQIAALTEAKSKEKLAKTGMRLTDLSNKMQNVQKLQRLIAEKTEKGDLEAVKAVRLQYDSLAKEMANRVSELEKLMPHEMQLRMDRSRQIEDVLRAALAKVKDDPTTKKAIEKGVEFLRNNAQQESAREAILEKYQSELEKAKRLMNDKKQSFSGYLKLTEDKSQAQAEELKKVAEAQRKKAIEMQQKAMEAAKVATARYQEALNQAKANKAKPDESVKKTINSLDRRVDAIESKLDRITALIERVVESKSKK